MNIDRDFASWVSCGAFMWYMKIHDTTDLARVALSAEQHKMYCRAAGRVLGYTLQDILEPIYKIYPDLTPEVLRRTPDAYGADEAAPRQDERANRTSVAELQAETLMLADAVDLNLRDIASLAKLRCAPDAARALEEKIGEIMEQVGSWRAFAHTALQGEDG
jgi:hypothetical protein